jgi:hypothetical protein
MAAVDHILNRGNNISPRDLGNGPFPPPRDQLTPYCSLDIGTAAQLCHVALDKLLGDRGETIRLQLCPRQPGTFFDLARVIAFDEGFERVCGLSTSLQQSCAWI